MKYPQTIYFISNDEHKIHEVKKILADLDLVTVEGYSEKISEIQSVSIEEIVKDKALKAYKKIGRPLLVDHTGLFIPVFGNFPGGLTQIFWDSLQADSFCNYFKGQEIIAKSILAYCDGKRIQTFLGEIRGTVAESPLEDNGFQWDCVFVPEGYDVTFAQMGTEER